MAAKKPRIANPVELRVINNNIYFLKNYIVSYKTS